MKNNASAYYNILLLLGLITMSSCRPSLVVNNSYDRGAIFQSYQTYAWLSPEAQRGEGLTVDGYSTQLDQQIRAAVESGLVKAGKKPTSERPDIYLAYDIALETEVELPEGTIALGFGYGYSYWYGYRFNYGYDDFPGYRTIDTYSPGTIIVDIVDASTNTLVWRGWADTAIDLTAADSETINRIVASIMAQYPPSLTKFF